MSGTTIRITHDLSRIPVILNDINLKAVKKAAARSIKRTFTAVNTLAGRTVSQEKLLSTRSLPLGAIKRRYLFGIEHASPNMPLNEMFARVYFSDKHISAVHFFAKKTPVQARNKFTGKKLHGVTAVMLKKKTFLGQAFMIDKGGKKSVLIREGKERKPLRNVWGPSLGTMFTALGLLARLQVKAQETYDKEFERNLTFYIDNALTKK